MICDMTDARREILDRVAAGDLSPEDAAEELARLDSERAGTERADNDPSAPRSEPPAATRRVKIVASAASVRVIGDPDIDTVSVEGEHVLTAEGDTTVVTINAVESVFEDDEVDDDEGGLGRGVVIIGTKKGTRRLRWRGIGATRTTTSVRVNPELPVEVDVSAGSATVVGLRAPLHTMVSAGKLELGDFRGPLEGSVNAGRLVARGVFLGESRLSADASSVTVDLEPGSDVVIGANLQLSSLNIAAPRQAHPETGEKVFLVGSGRGRFDVRGSMSKVHIDVAD